MDLEFRPALPEDASAAVPLMYSSGPAAFDYAFLDKKHASAQQFLLSAFRSRRSEFGYGNHTVVVHGDQVVGVGGCFSSDQAFSFLLGIIPLLLSFYGLMGTVSVIRRGLKLEEHFKLPDRKKSYLAHLGVPPEWQGRGIGRRLVEHFLDLSRKESRTHAVLDVSVENPRAQALYERIGFTAVEERISGMPGVPNHRRMEIPL